MVIFTIVCCHGNSLQYTHMNEKDIPDVWIIFTVNDRSLNCKLKQNSSLLVLHPSSGVDIVNTVGSHLKRFEVLKKCRNKSDCLVYEMLFIRRALKPNLDVQSDSIRAKVFVNSSSQNRFKCGNLHDLIYIFFENGVMTTPKRRILSFVLTILCLMKSLLIRTDCW